LKVERESQFNIAGGSEFQVRGAAVLNGDLFILSCLWHSLLLFTYPLKRQTPATFPTNYPNINVIHSSVLQHRQNMPTGKQTSFRNWVIIVDRSAAAKPTWMQVHACTRTIETK